MFIKKFIFIALFYFFTSSVIAEPISMRTLNEYMAYMQGPSAPSELRQGAMNLGAIHMTCYGKHTLDACKDALRQSGKKEGVKFLESFESYLPKLTELKEMKEGLESGKLNPYEPSNQAVYLQRSCSTDACSTAVKEYMELLELVRSDCSLTNRSNQNQFTVGRSWSCYEPVMEIQQLNSRLSTFAPPLSDAAKSALNALNLSTAQKALNILKSNSVHEKCEKSSALVDETICDGASFLPSYFNLIKNSIQSRGIASDGTIDIDRSSLFDITKDYDDLSQKASGDKYKGYSTVDFKRLLGALDQDSGSYLTYYQNKSNELKSLVEEKRKVIERQGAMEERHSELLGAVLNSLESDGYQLFTGGISDVLTDLQNGRISHDEVDTLVMPTRNIEGKLQEIRGSMMIFSEQSVPSFQLALAENDASQVIANGSLAAVCDCLMVRITETSVQRMQSGSLIQMFKIEPYTNAAVEAFALFIKQNSQAR
ncbi:hypothetical protein [Marinobacter sp. SS13-12]|uniref:hypothetical protein n=1 Tax=Marinobacter sp. SS13-12 TaxID=3050451 RepID=UPI00255725BE|nr:hypothetical protein [Marinobacter sp. SS13-12]MDK8465895.1 hypothetical protein [Marinobacter sp. SS13-12]